MLPGLPACSWVVDVEESGSLAGCACRANIAVHAKTESKTSDSCSTVPKLLAQLLNSPCQDNMEGDKMRLNRCPLQLNAAAGILWLSGVGANPLNGVCEAGKLSDREQTAAQWNDSTPNQSQTHGLSASLVGRSPQQGLSSRTDCLPALDAGSEQWC